jgi:hypothetical protein
MANVTKAQKAVNKVKFFQKHIVEGKSVPACAEELGLGETSLYRYKKSDDFRQMAIEHLENSTLRGLKGTVSMLVEELDSENPDIKHKALQEVIKIYGLYAPKRKDTTLTISISSDAELYRQIDEAQASRRFVASNVKGEEGGGMVEGEQGCSGGGFKARKRALLQDAPVS